MAENQLLIEITGKSLLEPVLRESAAQAQAWAQSVAGSAKSVQGSFDQLFESQGRADQLYAELSASAQAGAARDRALVQVSIDSINRRIQALKAEGIQVDQLREAAERYRLAENARIDSTEQGRAAAAAGEAARLQNELQLSLATGLERQALASRTVVAAIGERIDALAREGVEVGKLRDSLRELEDAQNERVARASDLQRGELERRVLELQARELGSMREITIAADERGNVERATNDFIDARARLAENVAEREIAALRDQYRGRSDLNRLLDQAETSLRRNVDLETRLARTVANRSNGFEVDFAAARASEGLSRLLGGAAGGFGPAGQVVRSLTGDLARMGSGLDSVIAKAGLSATSLIGIGLGATAIYAVGSAISDAADRAERFEENLAAAAARTDDFAGTLDRLKGTARDLAKDTGLGLDEVARATAAASRAFRAPEDQRALLRAAALASVAKQGPTDTNTEDLGRLLTAYQRPATEAKELANAAAISAARANAEFSSLIQNTVEASAVTRALGLTATDMFAIYASAKNQSGQSLETVSAGVQRLLDITHDTGNAAHEALRTIGVDFDAAGKGGIGFLGVLDQINTRINAQPNPEEARSRIFGDPKAQRQIGAALSATRQDFREITAQIATNGDFLDRTATQAGNEAAEQVKRFTNALEVSLQEAGEAFTQLKAGIVGVPLKLPNDVQFPDAIRDLSDKIQKEVAAGQLDLARRDLTELEALGQQSGEIYGRAFRDARDKFVAEKFVEHQQQLRRIRDPEGKFTPKWPAFNRDEVVDSFTPDLTFDRVVSAVRVAVDQARGAISDATAKIEAPEIPVKIAPRVDQVQNEIDAALRTFRATIPATVKVNPPEIEAALKVLEELQKKRASAGNLPLSGPEQGRAREAGQVLTSYANERQKLEDAIADLATSSLDGLERQAAEFDRAERSAKRYVSTLKLTPDEKSRFDDAFARANDKNDERLQDAGSRKFAELAVKRGEAEVTTLQKRRELATASGDIAQADALGVQIIEKRAEVQRRATEAAIIELRTQAQGYEDVRENLDGIAGQMREQVDLDRKLAEGANARANAERDRLVAERIRGVEESGLQGLDAELAAIRRNRREREAIDRRDIAAGTFPISSAEFERVLQFYDRIADRDEALARRTGLLSQLEIVAQLLGSVTDSYDAQTRAIDLAHAAESERLADQLRGLGASNELIAEAITLQERLTEAAKRQTAIQFATIPSARIAEDDLYTRALDRAGSSPQDRIDALTSAKNGPEAALAGFKAGLNDATRALNDFDFEVQAGGARVTTFRDSVAQGLENIGKKGAGADFVRANLENLRREFATRAANQITRGIFGEGAANRALGPDERLGISADRLSTAGDRLIEAAGQLSAAATVPIGPPGTEPGVLAPPSVAVGAPGEAATGAPSSESAATAEGAQQAGQEVAKSGGVFASSVTSAAQRAGQALVAGGQGAATFLTSLLGNLGDAAAKGLTTAITASFGTGGVYEGQGVYASTSPKANRVGGVYGQRTTIEVAERPGAYEAVIPMERGAIPVELRAPPERPTLREPPGLAQFERQHSINVAPARGRADTTHVDGRQSIEFSAGAIQIQIHAPQGADSEAIGRQVARQVAELAPRAVIRAMRSSRAMVDAVRDAR